MKSEKNMTQRKRNVGESVSLTHQSSSRDIEPSIPLVWKKFLDLQFFFEKFVILYYSKKMPKC